MMIEAELVRYNTRTLTIGDGPDRESSLPGRAVYIPSEQLLVRTEPHSNLIVGPLHHMYCTVKGEEAQNDYENLLARLERTAPNKIKVPESFVSWAKALHEASHPPEEISQILF